MKRDFPYSKNVILLIRSMEPNKPYFPFDIRGMLGIDHEKTCQIEKKAINYELIRSEQLSGRIHRYRLTEKGCRYHDELTEKTDEEFINSMEEKTKKPIIKRVKKEPKIASNIKEITERLGIRPDAKFVITSKGKDYLAMLTDEHDRLSRFSDTFSKRKEEKFRREGDKILFLETFKQKGVVSLADFINEVKRSNKGSKIKSYKHTFLPLIDEGYLQPVYNEC